MRKGQGSHRKDRPRESVNSIPGASAGKESACNAGALGSVPGLGRSPGGGNGNPRQYSCLENPMHRGAWWAAVIVHGVPKTQTRLATKTQERAWSRRDGSPPCRLQVKYTQLFQQKSHKPPPEIPLSFALFAAKTLNCDEEGQKA